jgi:hypothetical protein
VATKDVVLFAAPGVGVANERVTSCVPVIPSRLGTARKSESAAVRFRPCT